ncbi:MULTISPECIES: metallophosphoesterase [Actinotignum]|uniref:Metallophosphoesterase n=1 Tax=Actinotignum timonense TaxID=1870995 RepID=A0AAW9HM71_9ACTO|nr:MULTISPECIES: metallophosphoesterase [Actinotignum]MBS5748534.1 metallophosphoesterase [Actinotignum schaalii]MDE1558468.1 metallophosphoesterase [Actinotignum schaalii]MDE1662725.1 metallophosphoesterase [Actinotignum schaalii]MDK6373893.1 metallophosphoesterase [Actinotignum timonense]MDK6418393.1 metallophosphoesterase [Actinotignum timonense]
MRHVRRAVAALAAATLVPVGVAFTVPAAAEPVLPGVDSPALASTNENPVVVDGVTQPMDPRPGFRVLPYLQRPGAHEMTINWFTELGHNAVLTISGPGLPAEGRTYTVAGVQNPVNDYQDYELKQGTLSRGKALSVPQGAWIRADHPYKYSQRVEELQPSSTYTYTVTVDGYAHSATLRTLPDGKAGITDPLHIIAFSDTETDPIGRVTYREWEQTLNLAEGSEERPGKGSAWDEKFGGSTRNGKYAVNYMLTEDKAQEINNAAIAAAKPDLVLLPGDIAERASSQSHWDEWFRYFAGDKGQLLDSIPVITSLGNHEVYGYGSPDDRTAVARARAAYNQVFDTNGSDNANARDAYHRTDMGPVTIISLDSTNGTDQTPKTMPEETKIEGNDEGITAAQLGTDTQGVFPYEEYARDFPKSVAAGWWGPDAAPDSVDQPSFMPGSDQYRWLEKQLADARAKGQIIIVQYHHVAYSNGVHGTPMGHKFPDQQPGVPMRHLQPLFEKYNVASVFSGHDEMFQASYVDEAGDGVGVYHWDVGVASDGLRGEKMVKTGENGAYEPLRFNSHSVWMAQANEPEMWKTNEAGVKKLISGGKHYGHLDIKINPYTGPALDSGVKPAAEMVMTPISLFPILDNNYEVEKVERRELLSGQFTVYLDAEGNPLAGTPQDGTGDGGTGEAEEKTPLSNFALGVIPDTQFYSRYATEETGNQFGAMYGSEPFSAQTSWIAQNAEKYGIKMSMHLGDIVDQYNHPQQWEIADKAMKILEDAGHPYSILAGNHDVGADASDTDPVGYGTYKEWFGAERAAKNSTFVERDPSGAHEYHILKVNGQDFLVMNLSWQAQDDALQWASDVLDAHPTTPTIVNSHQLINVEGDGVTPLATEFGEKVWNKLIRNHDQVFLTFNGHHHGATTWTRTNDAGHPVYQVLMDYQMAYMGGNGYMGMVEFDLPGNKIYQTSFSPWVMTKAKDTLVPDDQAILNGAGQTFELDFNFAERFPNLVIADTKASLTTPQLREWLASYDAPTQVTPTAPSGAEDYPKVESTVAHWKMPVDKAEGTPVAVGEAIVDAVGGDNFTRAPLDQPGSKGAEEGDVVWTRDHHPLSANAGAVCFANGGRDNARWNNFVTAADAAVNNETFENGFTFETFIKISPKFDNKNNAWMAWLSRDGQRQNIAGYNNTEGEEPPFAWAMSNLAEIQFSFVDSQKPTPAESSAWSGEIVSRDQWLHLAVVNDPETKMTTMYVDGVPVLRNSPGTVGVGTQGLPWVLGAGSYAGVRESGFQGCIGEVRLVGEPLDSSKWLTARAGETPGGEQPGGEEPGVEPSVEPTAPSTEPTAPGTEPSTPGTEPSAPGTEPGDKPSEEPSKAAAPQGNLLFSSTALAGGNADRVTSYGRAGETIFVGDWDGDGVDTPGVRRGNTFLLTNAATGNAQLQFSFGRADDEIVIGDWNGDGKDTIGVRRGNTVYVRDDLAGGNHTAMVSFGRHGDQMVAGDWDGNGRDELAVRRGNTVFAQASFADTQAKSTSSYGRPGDVFLAGDWNGDGVDGIGVVRGNVWHLRENVGEGVAVASFGFGRAGDVFLAGDWNGAGADRPAVNR